MIALNQHLISLDKNFFELGEFLNIMALMNLDYRAIKQRKNEVLNNLHLFKRVNIDPAKGIQEVNAEILFIPKLSHFIHFDVLFAQKKKEHLSDLNRIQLRTDLAHPCLSCSYLTVITIIKVIYFALKVRVTALQRDPFILGRFYPNLLLNLIFKRN